MLVRVAVCVCVSLGQLVHGSGWASSMALRHWLWIDLATLACLFGPFTTTPDEDDEAAELILASRRFLSSRRRYSSRKLSPVKQSSVPSNDPSKGLSPSLSSPANCWLRVRLKFRKSKSDLCSDP